MTLTELYTALTGIQGFTSKVCYANFPADNSPQLPYITINETGTNNFGADNVVFFKRSDVDVEFYSEFVDTASEGLIEAMFEANGIYWNKLRSYLDSENCYETIYSIEVTE